MVFALVYCIVIVMHSVILAASMIGLLTGSLDGYFQGFPMDLGQTRGRHRLVWDVILLDACPKSYAAESGNLTVWDYSSMFTTTCYPSRCCVEFDSRIRPAMDCTMVSLPEPGTDGRLNRGRLIPWSINWLYWYCRRMVVDRFPTTVLLILLHDPCTDGIVTDPVWALHWESSMVTVWIDCTESPHW